MMGMDTVERNAGTASPVGTGDDDAGRVPVTPRQVRACFERALKYERILNEVRDLTGDSETRFEDVADALASLMADYADAAADAQKQRAEIVELSNYAYGQWLKVLSASLGDFWLAPAPGKRPSLTDVDASIRGLVNRYRARGLALQALARASSPAATLTGRAAGDGHCPKDEAAAIEAEGVYRRGASQETPNRKPPHGGSGTAPPQGIDYATEQKSLNEAGTYTSNRPPPLPAQPVLKAGKVAGVGKDEPTVVNERGGKQSRLLYRCDQLPALATLAVAAVLKYGGEKYGEDNWKNIPVVSHLNHLLVHVFACLAGDEQDLHLEHAATRALMALQLHLEAKADESGMDLKEAA